MTIKSFGATDRGILRTENQDSLMLSDQYHVYAVADGLGGLPEGALASSIAIESLTRQINETHNTVPLATLVTEAHQAVCEAGNNIGEEIGIGTTLTVAQIDEALNLNIAHVGDTGIFLLRDKALTKLTTDHTMAQELIERLPPAEVANIPDYFHHTLTRCLGQNGDIETDLCSHALQHGDRLLLYSDGVTKTLESEEIREAIANAKSPESLVTYIIGTGNKRGGPDNITAIALFIS